MHAREGEFGFLLLDAIGARHGVHAQAAFEHQALTHLHAALQVLSQAAKTHHLELARGVFRAQTIDPHRHLSNRHLVVLGVTDRGRPQHFHLKQAVIHVDRGVVAPILTHASQWSQCHG